MPPAAFHDTNASSSNDPIARNGAADVGRQPVRATSQSRSQKQLLIDTILRGYDIPKLYWRKISSKPERYDVVDGQQRLRANFEFNAGAFALPKDAEPIDDTPVAKLEYADLPHELRLRFDTYGLDVIVLSDTDEEEVREMFLRLQNGTTLKAQEKRNAMPGRMRDFVRSQRLFTHGQRLAIFRRDGGHCRVRLKCDGVKCDWEAWEADHIASWSRGGKDHRLQWTSCVPRVQLHKTRQLDRQPRRTCGTGLPAPRTSERVGTR